MYGSMMSVSTFVHMHTCICCCVQLGSSVCECAGVICDVCGTLSG